MENTIVGVDLAEDVIQTNKKVRSNTEIIPSEVMAFFANAIALIIVFEACGTSNYWKQ